MITRIFTCVPLAGLALLVGCGTPKTHYPAAAAAQEQQKQAEMEAPPADSRQTHQRLVEQMQREGMWYASLAHIDVLAQQGGMTPALQRLRGDALRQTQQFDAARQVYTQLTQAPTPAEAAAGWHGLGLLAGAQGEFAQATEGLERARQGSPADPRILGDLGYARLRAGQLAEARVPLMQAAQLQPQDQRAQLNLAAWLLASGEQAHTQRATSMFDALNVPEAARQAVQQIAAQARAAATGETALAAPLTEAPSTATVKAPVSSVAAAPQTGPLALRSASWRDARRAREAIDPPALVADVQ